MTCTLTWLDEVPDNKSGAVTLLQSPSYLAAIAELERQSPRYCRIILNGQDAGYAACLEKAALGRTLHTLSLDRGPVWNDGFGDQSHFEEFLKAFRAEFPRRVGRRVRIIPEITDNDDLGTVLHSHKFTKKSQDYQTITLDLTLDSKDIRAQFRKNWRGSLNKAEREELSMDWDDEGQYAHWLTKFYSFDRRTRGYGGPSEELLKMLTKHCVPKKEMLIGRVMQNGLAVAAIMLLLHGRAATYQIGWNTQKGRETGAHNFALWHAILELQKRETVTFDLGGVNDTEGEHVKAFKTGMGGTLITLPGVYVG
jgi:hypothetical protein